MGYLLLAAALLCSTSSGLLAAVYNRKNATVKNATPVYNLLMSCFALICWGIRYLVDFSFDPKVLLYSVGFGICYIFATVAQIHALRYGPLSLTSLLYKLSSIGATIWGFIFWGDKPSLTVIAGLLLVIVSMVTCLYQKNEQHKVSPKWLLFAILSFLGNTGCTIIQKQQQLDFNHQHGNMMMFFALIIAALVCVFLFLQARPENPAAIIRSTGYIPAASGVLNMALNLLVILLTATTLPSGLIYPTIGVGGLIMLSLASRFIFQEKLSTRQWIGMGIGIVAVLLLSL